MIRLLFRSLTPALTLASIVALAAYGGGGGDIPVTPGTTAGFVTNTANSSGVEGVLVSAGNKSTTTVSGGAYTLSGALPVAPVTAQITPLDPANNLGTMPGNYLAQSGADPVSLESFGAIKVMFTDANGSPLNLVSGYA